MLETTTAILLILFFVHFMLLCHFARAFKIAYMNSVTHVQYPHVGVQVVT